MLNGNSEVPALVRDTTAEQRGVGRIKYRDVGVCNALSLLIDDSPRQVEVGLVNAFHDHHAVGLGHAHGIEAHHLSDGIGEGSAMERRGDAEILQLVVDETHLVAA